MNEQRVSLTRILAVNWYGFRQILEVSNHTLIAGAFGTYLDLASALRVGMFPNQPLERFHQVGNAAGMGAKQMLLSLAGREEATRLAAQAHYVELTVEPSFTGEFMKAMWFSRSGNDLSV